MANAVTRAIDVVELLSERTTPLHAGEIGRLCGIPRSTTYELLETLRRRRVLEVDDDGGWSLGAATAQLTPGLTSIADAVAVIGAFERGSERADACALARRSALHAATVQRTLELLETEALVSRSEDGRYALGLRVALMAAKFRPIEHLQTAARPVLWKLRERIEETTSLLVRDGGYALYIDRFEARRPRPSGRWVGRHIPLAMTATGKAIADGRRPHSARDSVVTGITAVACAVTGVGEYSAAISVTGPNQRLCGNQLDHAQELLMGASREVSQRLVALR
jgi:DNA-binding IclR family transcriptional regulator